MLKFFSKLFGFDKPEGLSECGRGFTSCAIEPHVIGSMLLYGKTTSLLCNGETVWKPKRGRGRAK